MVRGDTVDLTTKHEVLHTNTVPLAANVRIPVVVLAELEFYPDIRDGTIVVIIAEQTILIDTRNSICRLKEISRTIFTGQLEHLRNLAVRVFTVAIMRVFSTVKRAVA